MDYMTIILTVCVTILTIILSVVGIYLIFVLMEFRRAIKNFNEMVDKTGEKFNALVKPLQELGGFAQGVSTGIKVFEAFVSWLQKTESGKTGEREN